MIVPIIYTNLYEMHFAKAELSIKFGLGSFPFNSKDQNNPHIISYLSTVPFKTPRSATCKGRQNRCHPLRVGSAAPAAARSYLPSPLSRYSHHRKRRRDSAVSTSTI